MSKQYVCSRDLWSLWIPNKLKFTKDHIYLSTKANVFINNQGLEDHINVEGWQKYFIPLDDYLEQIELSELLTIKQPELI